MRVSCPHCAAQYDFDPSMVPSAGYDAQCSACSRTFFVAPSRAAADATPSSERVVSVSCPNCQALYQFAASSVPAEGYSAQCTQCSAEFFVSVPRAVPATPFEPISEPVLLDQPKSVPSLAPAPPPGVASQGMKAATPPATQTTTSAAGRPAAVLAGEDPARPAIDDDLGSPDPATSTVEDDFVAILAARRRRRAVVLAVVVLVASLPLGAYVFVPRLFDATLGGWLGIKAPVPAALHAEVDAASRALLEDTRASRDAAVARLGAVLAEDPWFARAAALWGVAKVLEATSQPEPAAAGSDGESAAAPRARETLLAEAAVVLDRLTARFPEDPSLLEASAFRAVAGPGSAAAAKELLDRALLRSLGAGVELTAENAPTPWTLFVRAQIEATQADGLAAAVDTLTRLIGREPAHERAKQQRRRWSTELETRRKAAEPPPVVAPPQAAPAGELAAPATNRTKAKQNQNQTQKQKQKKRR